MINTTDRIVFCPVLDLDSIIRGGINTVLAHLEVRYGPPPAQLIWDSPHCFQYLFSNSNTRSKVKFGVDFVETALNFSMLSSRNEGLRDVLDQLNKNLHGLRPPACAISSIKQGIKLLLVELWQQKAILLPTIFSPGTHFDPVQICNEVYVFTRSFTPENRPNGISEGDARRLFHYMRRVLFATSWSNIEDVSLDELAELHRAHRQFITGQGSTPVITSPVPWVLFISELQKAFPERVSYSSDELSRYSQWTTRGMVAQSFADFGLTPGMPDKNSTPKKRKTKYHASENTQENGIEEFLILSKSELHSDALKYYQDYSGRKRGGFDWLTETPRYPGRDHVSYDILVPHWRTAMKAFLKHRKEVKGYEDEKSATSSLNVFADYLFLYLPWWKEIYPDSLAPLPMAPKDFSRYAYFHRSADEPLQQYPATFPELLKLRRSTDGQYAVLKQVQLFFRFVESSFSEQNEIAGPNFRNPIFDEFDLPRVAKRTKTSKIVFPRGAYRYLLHYAYAIEAMGEYLLNKCLANEFTTSELRQLSLMRWLNTEEQGFVPCVRVRGKLTPITHIPNVFSWTTRLFKNDGGGPIERFVPHLTTIRLLVAAIETGLRLSGLRWLDKRTWDQENRGEQAIHDFYFLPVGRYFYRLFVNTDKTKDKPWITDLIFRVRSMMLREEAFQNSIAEPDMDEAVPYKGRQHSRFGNIVPLFRGASSANPITENLYQDYWVLLLIGFQKFHSEALGRSTPFVKITAIPKSNSSTEPTLIVLEDGTQYCPLSIRAINTPHSCRATYATHRLGLVETSDVSMELGHSSTSVTGYYQAPRAEDLHERLEAADRALFCDADRFEQDNAAYVRPDKPGSAMMRSFMANREAAIQKFRVMPAITLWNTAETEDMSAEAIEELRSGPMSLVRFHPTHICPVGDECPADIVKSVGDFKRCGMCPLALKGIDHLPAIAAKKNALLERIRYQLKQRDTLEKAGEVEGAEELWDSVELDTNEWLGWQLSEEVLAKSHAEVLASGGSSEDANFFHTEEPEIVRQHLQRVVRHSNEVEFLLCRIAESNAYPTMQTPQVQAVASSIRRRLLGGRDAQDFLSALPGPADITLAASMLKTVMRAKQMSLSDLGNQLTHQPALPALCHLRIGESE